MVDNKKGTTKSGGQKNPLDKFYTRPEIAKKCLRKLKLNKYDTIIEPSAGNGSFSNQIDNVIAFDSAPESATIKMQDWFAYIQERNTDNKTLVVGNPPFGQQNSLAIAFINHAAMFADTIAFILPYSFMKESIQNKINKNFHLTHSSTLPKNSFMLNGEILDVPCVFQIWEYRIVKRKTSITPTIVGFEFVKKNGNPDFFLQRIGGNAGKFGTNWENKSEQSNYFIKAKVSLPEIEKDFNKLVFPQRDYSVGPRSISKKEILDELLSLKSKLVK